MTRMLDKMKKKQHKKGGAVPDDDAVVAAGTAAADIVTGLATYERDGPQPSSPATIQKITTTKPLDERVELMAMVAPDGKPFVRILMSKHASATPTSNASGNSFNQKMNDKKKKPFFDYDTKASSRRGLLKMSGNGLMVKMKMKEEKDTSRYNVQQEDNILQSGKRTSSQRGLLNMTGSGLMRSKKKEADTTIDSHHEEDTHRIEASTTVISRSETTDAVVETSTHIDNSTKTNPTTTTTTTAAAAAAATTKKRFSTAKMNVAKGLATAKGGIATMINSTSKHTRRFKKRSSKSNHKGEEGLEVADIESGTIGLAIAKNMEKKIEPKQEDE
jgi:hypothetical protein